MAKLPDPADLAPPPTSSTAPPLPRTRPEPLPPTSESLAQSTSTPTISIAQEYGPAGLQRGGCALWAQSPFVDWPHPCLCYPWFRRGDGRDTISSRCCGRERRGGAAEHRVARTC